MSGQPVHDPTCVFCRIIKGEIPSHKVYEDDVVFAFLDIGPVVKGHTLVVPKAHYRNVMETPGDVLAALNQRLPQLTRAVLQAVGAPACHVLVNSGPEASQSVQHLHYHILPRYDGDGYQIHWPTGKLEVAAAQEMVKAISAGLETK